ncbi:2,4-dihydroxyhept-2-ene-1,7-dioic acid aldolase [Amycolatopsis sp. K13G38]|uniref:2,4-dihydroxyhept-2-ene-1,7-dioic acid aldolase n=1 Tax=Amycolatopsis acididurans TaxID=2724524 RepID=A0ABX1JE70_9PSEU|nr:aldolase/citrate lyase family protein [Amycolatopsis acididurans]NKQ58034.1 2,4-dihydroxyhept-2-ene-1,7-dioic acid aldolase [Amycolatopsis acididurans]
MSLRELIEKKTVTYGGWCSLPSPLVAEVLGRAGFDWICVDCQHGFVNDETLVGMLQALDAAGRPGLVRVRWNDPAAIMKALDAGAQGVLVPMVNSPEDAARAAQACRYPPAGIRSWGLSRHVLGRPYDPASANHDTVCAIQIETTGGLRAAKEILAVPGIDVAYVGPADLAVSAGIAPTFDVTDPQHEQMINTVLRACLDQGTVPGIHAPSQAAATRWRDAGFRLITAATDIGYLRAGAHATLHALDPGPVP